MLRVCLLHTIVLKCANRPISKIYTDIITHMLIPLHDEVVSIMCVYGWSDENFSPALSWPSHFHSSLFYKSLCMSHLSPRCKSLAITELRSLLRRSSNEPSPFLHVNRCWMGLNGFSLKSYRRKCVPRRSYTMLCCRFLAYVFFFKRKVAVVTKG